MSEQKSPEFPDVPLVGQPAEVVNWYPTTLVRCKCTDRVEEKRLNFVFVHGFGNYSACGVCGVLYYNSHLVQEPNSGKALMVIGHVLPTSHEKVN